ncbi:hypothetical protein HAX54_001618, partial [Datura stramonium]|nr:hypothetical protein [Datura stramonium]
LSLQMELDPQVLDFKIGKLHPELKSWRLLLHTSKLGSSFLTDFSRALTPSVTKELANFNIQIIIGCLLLYVALEY